MSKQNEVTERAQHLVEATQEVADIDAHVNDHLRTTANLKAIDLEAAYKGVRPVLKFARSILFFKPKWQHVLDMFIASLDSLYKIQ